jgi:hypothetical protein
MEQRQEFLASDASISWDKATTATKATKATNQTGELSMLS